MAGRAVLAILALLALARPDRVFRREDLAQTAMSAIEHMTKKYEAEKAGG